MPKKPLDINLKTPREKLSREENNKLMLHLRQNELAQAFRDNTKTDLEWQMEAIAKSHGIYLEFDRAKESSEEKHWMYMIRISIPGGGPITRAQWNLFNELCDKHTKDSDGIPSLRFTNRQNIQFHWVDKAGTLEICKRMAEAGLNSLNGCGDNTRNVMGCPLGRFSDVYNANAWAQKAGEYFQLPIEPFIKVFEIDPTKIRKPGESFNYGPQLLNRKFKIAFATVHKDETGKLVPDNCVEALTNDMAVVPVVENNKVTKFQIYIGGGQGERNGKLSMAALGLPLCQIDEKNLLKVMDAVLQVHQEWGDRENRWWARLKFVVKKMGIDWYRDQVSSVLGFPLEKPNANLDFGNRHLHFGWTKQPSNGLWAFGAFIENGRVNDISPNGKLKSMITHVMNKYPIELYITPNQDALFTNIPESSKKDFENDLRSFGWGQRNGKEYSTLRLHSGACVGRDTCRLTYTDSEKFEPFLIDELEAMGWGDLKESIGITGCERQCFRPATKAIGLVGSGMDRYMFKLFGDETGRFQGKPLTTPDGEFYYLRSVPRDKCAVLIDALFKFYKQNAKNGEGLGEYHRRIGAPAIIKYLQENPDTTALLGKPFPADHMLERDS